MDGREQRGLVIAALCKLNHNKGTWLVPSQSHAEQTYRVNPEKQTCTCPDYAEHGHFCKHLFAVKYTIQREIHSDGRVTETKSITFTEQKTYRQDWSAYNRAQSIEKDRFQELLFDLCSGLEIPERSGRGRKPHTIRDSIFAMVFKVYGGASSRRTSSDLRESHRRGFLSREFPGVKVCDFFNNPEFTPLLRELVARSARPLRTVETDFAIDSSGFSTSKFERWFDHKWGVTRMKQHWVKVHIACGVKTNVVTAVRILDKDAADHPQFVPLVNETAKNFKIGEVSADKAYTSVENFEAVAGHGGTGYMAFKSNATGAAGGLYEKMFRFFQYKQDEYMERYHKRSNVESTFSMVKRKFGDSVRAKTEVSMVNETLCKFLAHNLCVLIQEQCELGIEAEFWKDEPKPHADLTCNEIDSLATEFIG